MFQYYLVIFDYGYGDVGYVELCVYVFDGCIQVLQLLWGCCIGYGCVCQQYGFFDLGFYLVLFLNRGSGYVQVVIGVLQDGNGC